MSKAQQLQAKAATLPEPIAAEVLDFLEFVAAKRAQERTPRIAKIANSNPRTAATPSGKLPTFRGGQILADPREMKQLLYASHE
jgi:uncharacterized protein (DUF3084 family)